MTQIPIIWGDNDLLVIDKPAGMLALPDGYDPALPHVKSLLSPRYGPLWIAHRLDRFTSALVLGNPEWDRKIVALPLKINAGRRHRTVIDLINGKPSVTQFVVCERFKDYCLIEAVPETRRRHQIRAHLLSEGYPVACDSLYGNQIEIQRSELDSQWQPGDPVLKRPGLHARSIELVHPLDDQMSVFESPLASDLELTLEIMRN